MNDNSTRQDQDFGERMAQVLGADPSLYHQLIIAEPTPGMWDIVDSLALDGDPQRPELALAQFAAWGDVLPEQRVDRWLAGLRDAAQQFGSTAVSESDHGIATAYMRRIYADPTLYEVLSEAEPGYGLIEIVESLALEGDADDIASMLQLMRSLQANGSPA